MSSPDTTDRMEPRQFDRLAARVEAEVGIQLPPSKRDMVEGRLRKWARAEGFGSLRDYAAHVLAARPHEETWTHVIDALTTNKTDFFREPPHYEILETRIVPELLAARRPGAHPRLKLWSAAASTGAELWSAGMVLGSLALERRDFEFALLGTDISTEVLETARRAIYPVEQLDPAPRDLAKRWLLHGTGPARGQVRIAPELRRRARFERLNLMDASFPVDRDVDVIFLRNVLIYFARAEQSALVSRLVDHLRPGGWLVLGHSEAPSGDDPRIEAVAPAVFRLDREARR